MRITIKDILLHSAMALTLFLLLFTESCQKDINIKLPNPEEKIVVEGHIEPGKKAYVLLTKNAPYFAPTDLNSLQKYIVHNALVTITDGSSTDTMKELVPGAGYYYQSVHMTGQIGKTYTITIQAEGKTLTSSTTILPPVPLDSIWFKVQPGKDSLGYIWAHLTDPPAAGNAYRWFAKRVGQDTNFIAPMGSVFDDKFFNGESFDFAYNRGAVPNSNAPDDVDGERGYFKKGETVIVKFCSIEEDAYRFYRSYETQVSSNGNPFASPSPIPSNITNGLGIWCSYGPVYDTIVIPH